MGGMRARGWRATKREPAARSERTRIPGVGSFPPEFVECMEWAAELGLSPVELVETLLRASVGELARFLARFEERVSRRMIQAGETVSFHVGVRVRDCTEGEGEGCEVCEEMAKRG